MLMALFRSRLYSYLPEHLLEYKKGLEFENNLWAFNPLTTKVFF